MFYFKELALYHHCVFASRCNDPELDRHGTPGRQDKHTQRRRPLKLDSVLCWLVYFDLDNIGEGIILTMVHSFFSNDTGHTLKLRSTDSRGRSGHERSAAMSLARTPAVE